MLLYLMKKIYSIVTYLLLLPASFLGLMCVFLLLASLATFSPQPLLLLFIVGSVVIYTFCINIFNHTVLVQNKTVRAKLKDWIKVNAFVAGVFAVYSFSGLITYLLYPIKTNQELDELTKQQITMAAKEISPALLLQIMKATLIGIGVYGLLLLLHITYSVFLLKKYKHKFQ